MTNLAHRDIWVLPVDGPEEPVPFLVTPFNERSPAFSPDGEWIAYASDETGTDQIYLQPFPGPGQKIAVSVDGGYDPVWSRDGSELFYRQGTAVVAVSIANQPRITIGTPVVLFDGPYLVEAGGRGSHSFDVDPDGRFLMVKNAERTEAHLVLNWSEELQRLVPTH